MTPIYERKLTANDWLMTMKYKNLEVLEWSESLGTREEIDEDRFKDILRDSRVIIKNNDIEPLNGYEYTVTSEWINDR